jgi:hypothetical protein
MTTMFRAVINGREIWWDTSCRTEGDWYARTMDGKFLADHCPTNEEAIRQARATLAEAGAQ